MSRSKGVRNERKVDEVYQEAGYLTYRPENASYGDNDLWNLFDIAAIHLDGPVRFVQVKSNGTQGELRDWMEHQITTYCWSQANLRADFVVVHDGQGGPHGHKPGIRMARPTVDGHEWVFDGRENGKELGVDLIEQLRPENMAE